MKKFAVHLLSLVLLVSFVAVPTLTLASGRLDMKDIGVNEIDANLKLGRKDPITTATSLINTAMIFLGIIAVAIIIMAGFKWMTAGGSEEKVNEAKKLMSSGVIGLIIILAAWGIARFIIEKALEVTN